MTILAGSSEQAMAEERVNARKLFGDGKSVVAGDDAERRESGGGAGGNWRACKRMRQSFYIGVVFERDVRGFVGGDECEH
jgi:hypothetical protein